MLCQQCGKREATVHLTKTNYAPELGEVVGTEKQHFCEPCADAYFAATPGMNAMRNLICLSDSYRSKLYDLLEDVHPEAFDNHDTEACRRGSETMMKFLREHLKKDGVEVTGDAFDMLCQDFFGSHHFYTRSDEFNRKKR
jgi:protein-arginine kinase activator protein McsA